MNKSNKKPITNEQAFKELFKNLDLVEIALLRERVLLICEETAKDCINWENPFISPNLFIKLNEKVKNSLGFD